MKIFIISVLGAHRSLTSEEWDHTHIYNMILIMLLTSILIISTVSIFISITPLTIGISILIIALSLAIIYSWLMSSWIAFLIFLIYVRGMLVIFAYFVALAPNQKTNISITVIPVSIAGIITITLIRSTKINIYVSSFIKTSINIFYLKTNIFILIILALILLLTIIVVVKLVTSSKGPLRPFINYV